MTAWRHGSIDVLLPTFILEELQRVLPKLAQRHGLSQAEIADLVDALFIQAEVVDLPTDVDPALRDMNDQSVLAALKASGADYLISGDKDFLALAEFYPIVPPSVFWTAHGGL